MNKTKQDVVITSLNKKIKNNESALFTIEKQIQTEKSSLGSIVVNNRESAPVLLKGAKSVSVMLFGLSLPYAFSGNIAFASIAIASSMISYGIYASKTKLDKHDKVWRKKCQQNIEDLKKQAKVIKVKLYELYKQADEFKTYNNSKVDSKQKWSNKNMDNNNDNTLNSGVIFKDPVLEQEIKNDFKKPTYKKVYNKVFSNSTNENSYETT